MAVTESRIPVPTAPRELDAVEITQEGGTQALREMVCLGDTETYNRVGTVRAPAAVDEYGLVVRPIMPGAGNDAFGRLRVSDPVTLFDSKQLFDNKPLFWDDQETSGSGTTSVYSQDRASTTIGVGASTAGTRVRQTFQRFNYQPGKSFLVLDTARAIDADASGITYRLGYFDENNGLFFESDNGSFYFVRRSNVTGTPVDARISDADWNVDKFDGTGPSGITLGSGKVQIYWIDFEWLGVGSVRFGLVVNGQFYVAHQSNHANILESVYMSTPNLPIRYEISNDGTGPAASLEQICSSVISEGGAEPLGTLEYETTGGTHIDANAVNTIYACIGVRLKSAALAATVEFVAASMNNATNDDFEWLFIYEPTVAGTFTYSDKANSVCQTAIGVTANTVTGGTIVAGGFVKSSGNTGSFQEDINNALRLGAAIDGTPTEYVLCVRPLAANADIDASISWRELS